MKEYILRRILITIPIFFAITILIFIMIHLLPGDPITIWLGSPEVQEWDDKDLYKTGQRVFKNEQVRSMVSHYGLDKPIHIQYLTWVGLMLKGDLGQSIHTKQPVLKELLTKLPITLELMLFSLLIAILISIPSGVLSATHQHSKTDYACMSFALSGLSTPEFVLGVLLILIFSVKLNILPSIGFVDFSKDPLLNIAYLILPAFTLGMRNAAILTRLLRSSMLEVIRQDFIKTARSKGIPERLVIYKHALKNSLIPFVTVVGLQIGYLMGGSIIIEKLFAIPGIGLLGITAIINRDYPVIMGFILILSTTYLVVNLVVDLVYALLDPRIHYGKKLA